MDQLTPNAITKFFTLADISNFHPIVQITADRICPQSGDSPRHKLLVSDGNFLCTAITIGANMHQKLSTCDIKFCIVRIENANIQKVQDGKKCLIIVDFTVLRNHPEKIGDPQKFDVSKVKVEPASQASAHGLPVRAGQPGGLAGMMPSDAQAQPISSLNPYQSKWLIKARVTKKSDIRTWSNARGEGKLFSMDLCDESGEIRCTGFGESVDKFFNIIEQGKVYYISRCTLKTANKQFTAIKNDYEMTMNNDTSITRAEDDTSVPEVPMNFTDIADLDKVEPNGFVDIVGIATQISDVQNITSKLGKELTKREIKIQDKSGAAVSLTLWGSEAINFDAGGDDPVVAVKAAKVSDFGGRTVSVSFNSTLMINPDTPYSHNLKGWYLSEGRTQEVRQMSGSQGGGGSMETPVKSFEEAKRCITEAKPEYFSNTCTLTFVKKDNCLYKACPSADCNKKVIQEGESEYRCEKCNRLYPDFKYRLMLSAKLADMTGVEWVTLFQENAEKLIGRSTEELGQLKDAADDQFDKALDEPLFRRHTFKIRGKLETWNDETRTRMSVFNVADVDPIKECERMLREIEQYD